MLRFAKYKSVVCKMNELCVDHVVSIPRRNDIRDTQRIVSVNDLFRRPLIRFDFLKGIFTPNFRDMGNLRSSVFGLIKMSFREPKKGQLRFSERK